MYLKFILDLHDEEWIRIVNQKEGKGLLLEEIVSEFEIIPYKSDMYPEFWTHIYELG